MNFNGTSKGLFRLERNSWFVQIVKKLQLDLYTLIIHIKKFSFLFYVKFIVYMLLEDKAVQTYSFVCVFSSWHVSVLVYASQFG